MFSKILVAIDGSPSSYRGLQYATDVAKKYEAEITLIHVLEEPIYGYTGQGIAVIPQNVFTEMEKNAEKLFEKRRRDLTEKRVRVRTLLKWGNPAAEILKASEGFDLIVIGSRGLGRLKRLLLGSVASSVAQQSKVPVLIVKPEK